MTGSPRSPKPESLPSPKPESSSPSPKPESSSPSPKAESSSPSPKPESSSPSPKPESSSRSSKPESSSPSPKPESSSRSSKPESSPRSSKPESPSNIPQTLAELLPSLLSPGSSSETSSTKTPEPSPTESSRAISEQSSDLSLPPHPPSLNITRQNLQQPGHFPVRQQPPQNADSSSLTNVLIGFVIFNVFVIGFGLGWFSHTKYEDQN